MAVAECDRALNELEELASLICSYQERGQRVALCHGVFDLLHIGHIRHFQQARELGDLLVVTLTPDRYVNKGPHRPAFEEALRAEAVGALSCVDFVAINRWPTAVELVELLRPDLYVKGSDYRIESDDLSGGIRREREAIEAVGGQLCFTKGITFSSSSLLNRHFSPFSEALQASIERHKSSAKVIIEALLCEGRGELARVEWQSTALTVGAAEQPYFDGKPRTMPSLRFSEKLSDSHVALLTAADAYLSDSYGRPPTRAELAKFMDHLLR